MDDINPYSTFLFNIDIYSYCYYNDSFALGGDEEKKQFLSQESILLTLAKSSG